MLTLRNQQPSLWDKVLPKELLDLPGELKVVDQILDDPRFFRPFLERFDTRMGRPAKALETYIRMMYLKFRYDPGYGSLAREVSDSIKWRRFCRISLDGKVPDRSTLIKSTKRYGPEVVEELNKLLLLKAREEKVLRGRKLRVDTTVVESNIHYPTDASLLADGIRVITRTVKKIKETGAAVRTRFQDRTRSVKKRIFNIAKVLRRRTGKAVNEIDRITEEIVNIATAAVKQAENVARNAAHKIWRDGKRASAKTKRLLSELKEQIEVAEVIIEQAKEVVSGNRSIKDRVVSIFDTEARPIKKGKQKSPAEFGYKILIGENEDRVITVGGVYRGNPPDSSLLEMALKDHEDIVDRVPWGIAADRGFSSKDNEELCQEKGIKRISLPRKGRLSKKQKEKQSQSWFKRLQRFRAGGEATISVLKRVFGLGRSMLRGYEGARIWVGNGILAYNLRRLATLM